MIADNPAPPRRFGPGAFVLALLVNVAFALNIIAMKVVVDATAPLTSVALRMAMVFLLCLPALRRVPGRTGALAAYGFLNGGVFLLLLNVALFLAVNVGAIAIAGQLGTPFSLILGALVLGETLSPKRAAGVALAFAGVALLVFDPAIIHEVRALIVMVGATLAWGTATLFQRRLGGVSVLNTQAWNGLVGAVILLPFVIGIEGHAFIRLGHLGAAPLGWFAFSCIGSTIFGQGMLAWLLQRYPISTVMPLMLTSPVMAALFASLYFGTRITMLMALGGLIAFAGVAIASLGGRAAPAAEPAA